jgi:hypothetical protein
MCTVTIVPLRNGFRLACNRDEQRRRVEAQPPRRHSLQHRMAIFPVDPLGSGTWVGANDAGLAAALLNRTVASTRPAGQALRSRGLIIPALLGSASLAHAIDVGAALNPRDFDPFRLILAQDTTAVVIASDGLGLSLAALDLSTPMMLTSSSLGDALVDTPRRALFDRLFAGSDRSWLRAQRRFHQHQWRAHGEISVRMERGDARTVSHTVVDVNAYTVTLRYRPVDPTALATVGVAS